MLPISIGELLKLGTDVSQATVANYMGGRRQPPSQTWGTFLRNHIGRIVAANFFVVPTATYLLFFLVLLTHDRRRIQHVAVTAHPTAAWTAQQLGEAFPWDEAPRYLFDDRDHAFERLKATTKPIGMDDVLTAPHAPWHNAFVERFSGSARRECPPVDFVVPRTTGSRMLAALFVSLRSIGLICSAHRAIALENLALLFWRWTGSSVVGAGASGRRL